MKNWKKLSLFFIIGCIHFLPALQAQENFVQRKGSRFVLQNKPYVFIGTNYWYGGLLGLQKNPERGKLRLQKELDFLKSNGVDNLRVVVGAEGSGMINGMIRIGPPLQTAQGKFDEKILTGLDLLLAEMGKRGMKAVLFFSNNWEWSGGFQQYLIWNNLVPKDQLTRKLTWDEQRDMVSKFYTCQPCKMAYHQQVDLLLNRTNSLTKKKYTADPAIMAWELANEPRPMRTSANKAYQQWISEVAARIKAKDRNHLVTIGHEGNMGSENMQLFEDIHDDKNIDYVTIHIWPKNWSWFKDTSIAKGFENVVAQTKAYISQHAAIAQKLQKPMVLEEFGLPRDRHSFDPASPTTFRDRYYDTVFSALAQSIGSGGPIAGAGFWAFGGTARPKKGQIFWKKGDEYMGDPPMEEQGLNTVFDSDASTWRLISSYVKKLKAAKSPAPIDKNATTETKALFYNLMELSKKHTLFGHQHATEYGHGWAGDEDRSDVKSVTDSHPAVIGVDLSGFSGRAADAIQKEKERVRKVVQETYNRGGVVTISWHFNNPVSGGGFYWKDTVSLPAVKYMIPGGKAHETYKEILTGVGDWAKSTKGKDGELVPMIFRPYHEFDGGWFWWGATHCTREEFVTLWRFTVSYLRDSLGVHNFLYAFSPDNLFLSENEYLHRYPGDEWVDMVGMDNYGDMGRDGYKLDDAVKKLKIVSDYAVKSGKLAAFTETGLESIPNPDWWTDVLLKVMKKDNMRLSYVLVWRNDRKNTTHFYAPFPGHSSVPDFIKFYNDPYTLFEKDLKNIYSTKEL